MLRGKFSLACTGSSLLLLGSLGTEGDKMLILEFQNCSYCGYSSYSYRYRYTVAFQFQIDAWWKSLWFSEKSPSTTLKILSIGGNAPKQVSLSLGQTTSVLDKRLFRSMMESLRNGLQWKRPYFRRQDFKSFQREAASLVSWEILRGEALYIKWAVLCGSTYRRLLQPTTCVSILS